RRYYQGFVEEHAGDPELQAELAAAHLRIATLAYQLGAAEDWVPPFQKSVDLMEEVLRRKPDAAAFDCFGTGIVRMNAVTLTHHPNPDETRRAFTKGRDVWEELVRTYPRVPAFQNDLAAIYLILGFLQRDLPEDSVRFHRRASDLWRHLSQTSP